MVTDLGRQFDDLLNLVHDLATLIVVVDRVAGNCGAHTSGVDGLSVTGVEVRVGFPGYLPLDRPGATLPSRLQHVAASCT